MTHPFQEYLAAQVADHLTQRRVVVWYDPRAEFTPFINELRGQPADAALSDERVERITLGRQAAQLACYDGSFFAVRGGRAAWSPSINRPRSSSTSAACRATTNAPPPRTGAGRHDLRAAVAAAGAQRPATQPLRRALSIKVEVSGQVVCRGVLGPRQVRDQAMAGVPVTARQVAQRSSRIWR